MHGNEYETPQALFDSLNAEFNFTFDLACSKTNRKVEKGFHAPEYDSLLERWSDLAGWLWLNPPYSPLKPWIQKAQTEHQRGARIVMLVPPIISTRYFSQHLPSEIRFILGRVPFILGGKPMKSNTSDSCLLIYGEFSKQPLLSYVERECLMPSAQAIR